MNKHFTLAVCVATILFLPAACFAENNTVDPKKSVVITVTNVDGQSPEVPKAPPEATEIPDEYTIGINDVLDIHVLKPESMFDSVVVAPDGRIVFPYIGSVIVKNRTIAQVQDEIQSRLADGYMKYPVVSVSLAETNSRRFFVYGEVVRPGGYSIEENMTVLRAISMAGGFSQFGSSSRVKVLRPKKVTGGYDVIKVDIKAVMDGAADADPEVHQGDIIVVSEGIF